MNQPSRIFLVLGLAAAWLRADAPTFNREVVRIFQQQCQSCHHPGAIGPFSLMDYQNAMPHARSIRQRVADHTMPVWKPVPGIGDFLNAEVLTQQQIDTIAQWVDAGSPEGDPADLPQPLSFPDGWALGQPDLVLSPKAPFTVAPGEDLYRCFSIPTGLSQDRFVSAVDVKVGNRTIVHHAIVFADPQGRSAALAGSDPAASYTCFGDPGFSFDDSFLVAWAPGITPAFLSQGTAMKLFKNTRLAIQVHYHPSASGGADQTQIGIYLTNNPVDKIVRQTFILNDEFTIPAGNPSYQVKASLPIPADLHAVSVLPHMHLLGRQMKAQATYPDRRVAPMIQIDDWDFDYQAIYQYRQPIALPNGSLFDFTATYGNSADNPRNPNSPPKPVSWGNATTDEMAVLVLGYTVDAEHLSPPQVSASGIVNAASYAGGASAPGTIATLFGAGLTSSWESASSVPLPRTLSKGVRVTVGGIDAPLFYASPSQINFQIPYEVTGSAATLTFTRSEDGAKQSIQLPLGKVHPGIYTTTSDGKGPAVAAHVNGDPVGAGAAASRGEWLVMYANGLGQVTPGVPSGTTPAGLSSTVNPVSVNVGGAQAEVYFAGLSGYVGLYQVNFRIPEDAPAGSEVPVSLTVDGVQSNVAKMNIR